MSAQKTGTKEASAKKVSAATQVAKTDTPSKQGPQRPTRAVLKNFPVSARKMRRLVDMVRGMRASQALASLKFAQSPHSVALEKLLLSSIANWQSKHEDTSIEENKLYLKTATVDSAHMLKRFRPAPQGRAHRIRKRYSHICFVMDAMPENENPSAPKKKRDPRKDTGKDAKKATMQAQEQAKVSSSGKDKGAVEEESKKKSEKK